MPVFVYARVISSLAGMICAVTLTYDGIEWDMQLQPDGIELDERDALRRAVKRALQLFLQDVDLETKH